MHANTVGMRRNDARFYGTGICHCNGTDIDPLCVP
jgi:hypothetical protein